MYRQIYFFRVALQKLLHLLRVFFRSIAHVHMRYTSLPEPFRDQNHTSKQYKPVISLSLFQPTGYCHLCSLMYPIINVNSIKN